MQVLQLFLIHTQSNGLSIPKLCPISIKGVWHHVPAPPRAYWHYAVEVNRTRRSATHKSVVKTSAKQNRAGGAKHDLCVQSGISFAIPRQIQENRDRSDRNGNQQKARPKHQSLHTTASTLPSDFLAPAVRHVTGDGHKNASGCGGCKDIRTAKPSSQVIPAQRDLFALNFEQPCRNSAAKVRQALTIIWRFLR